MLNNKKLITVLLFALQVSFSRLDAETIEIKEIAQVYHYASSGALVIFDIDNTLIEPVQELGNDQWFQHRMHQLRNSGLTKAQALKQAVLDWEAIRNVTEMKLVEKTARDLIENLQNKNIEVMGLTTQSFSLALRTINHLEKLEVDLMKTAPFKEDEVFKTTYPILHMKGILFTGGSDKGTALERLFSIAGYKPKKIVFINDKGSNLIPVEKYCAKAGIPFTGLRYGYLDEKAAKFNKEIAEVQWSQFGKILPNDKAIKESASYCEKD